MKTPRFPGLLQSGHLAMTSFQPGLLSPILEHIPPQKHPCTTFGKRQTSSSRRFCPGGRTSGVQGGRVRGGNSPEDDSLDLDLESIRSARRRFSPRPIPSHQSLSRKPCSPRPDEGSPSEWSPTRKASATIFPLSRIVFIEAFRSKGSAGDSPVYRMSRRPALPRRSKPPVEYSGLFLN